MNKKNKLKYDKRIHRKKKKKIIAISLEIYVTQKSLCFKSIHFIDVYFCVLFCFKIKEK